MTRDVLTIGPEESLAAIATLMTHRRIRRLPVVEVSSAGPVLVGIVSYSDVLHAFPANINPFSAVAEESLTKYSSTHGESKMTARGIMRGNPLTTSPDEPIEQVAQLMRVKKIGALPVLQGKTLVGLITESDLFRAFASIFETKASGVRITFDVSSGEDIFPVVAEIVHKHRLRVVTFVTLLNHARPLCVVEVTGREVGAMIEDIWKSKHSVVNVIHLKVHDPVKQ